jgi:predicted Rossmann-fold nucleotide-binding protein
MISCTDDISKLKIATGMEWSTAMFRAMLKTMADTGMISPSDLDLLHVTDSVEQAMGFLHEKAVKTFDLKPAIRQASPWLGESGL